MPGRPPPPEPLPVPKYPSVVDSLEWAVGQAREAYRLNASEISGWYVALPEWVIAKGGGWDAFAAEFEKSWARKVELQLSGIVGFEVCEQHPGWGVRRYTLVRFRQQEEQQ